MKKNKENKPKYIYVIVRQNNWCWLDEIFYNRKQAIKYLKKIKGNNVLSFKRYIKIKIKKIILKA